jgi:hypothetical protein
MSNTVQGLSCSYVNLSNYNSTSEGSLGSPPLRAATVSGSYVVPNYAPIRYDALSHGDTQPSCSGYFNIKGAYGANAADCNTEYMTSDCTGTVARQ